jgi:hypothetical protein
MVTYRLAEMPFISCPVLEPGRTEVGVIDCHSETLNTAVEFDSIEQGAAGRDSPAYQAASAALGDGTEHEIPLIEVSSGRWLCVPRWSLRYQSSRGVSCFANS